jgi:simple sugar transport system ATP-binding protein
VPANEKVEDLSVGVQQRAELIKALARDARVLILDEPTSVITPQEADDLSQVLLRLAGEGVGIFFISHKLEEVLRIADRITVLRLGRVVGTLERSEASRSRLAEMMVGELATPAAERARSAPADTPALVVDGLSAAGDFGRVGVRDVSFSVAAGEVVGIAGVEGSGQVELVEAIAGVRPIASGSIRLNGTDVSRLDVRQRQRLGVAHIPADRQRAGFIPTLTIAENLLLPVAGDPPYERMGLLRPSAMEARARELIREYDIRVAGPRVAAGTLSGGNQQRLVLGRELSRDPRLVLASFATRGLDFASTEAVHRRILEMRERGAAVLYASVELDELLELTDRIIVLYHGRLAGEVATDKATSEELGMLMGGSEA